GILPVPVPAVANIVADEGLILRQGFMQGEYVTPTGAAIVAAIRGDWRSEGTADAQNAQAVLYGTSKTNDCLPEQYTIEKVGIGGGKRAYDPPSMVRAMWLREVPAHSDSASDMCGEKHMTGGCGTGNKSGDTDGARICRLETDIDDSTGEELGRVMELCYSAGAREVHFTPIYMKKNRPAYELVVITDSELIERMEQILFKETTTIGIRRQWMDRTVLPRESVTVETPYGEMQAKKVTLPDGETRIYPEYESAVGLANKNGVALKDIMNC
ncbi:MAG: LarC family nickel insertion protein, partial [Eubacterium sp.]|nr:LarC family nickel insertion protein [Eubacterium sp.]